MSLYEDNCIQETSGTQTGSTSVVVTLPSGTTAGSTVVVMLSIAASITTPATGFVLDAQAAGGVWVYHLVNVGAGVTSWTFTQTGATEAAWYVAEWQNVDPVEPLDVFITNGTGQGSVGNGGTVSTGTTPLNAGLSTVAYAAYGIGGSGSWSGYTNGFGEVADVPGSGSGRTLAVARKFTDGTTGTFQCTATYATAGAGSTGYAVLVVFRAADAPVASPLSYIAGFEWGTHGGMGATGTGTLTVSAFAPLGTWGTNYLIQAASARSSGYGLRVVASGAAAAVMVAAASPAVSSLSIGFNVRVVSGTGTVVVALVPANAALFLIYDTSTNKYGLRWGTAGTPSWQSGTTALNTWVWVDIRLRTNVNPYHADWRIETATNTYTDQTSPADSATAAAAFGSLYTLTLASDAAQTSTIEFDDVVLSRYYAAYPLGPHSVRLLRVDPAGTPTVSGTTTNFSTFASNGTLTAWNATTARNALDDVPPTVSAAADGVVQTASAASDYMQFPMETYAATTTEIIAAVRMYAPLWSGAGAGAGDLAIRGHDGTTETALATVSQITPGAPTATSSTAPVWRTAMWQSTNGWTQAELDAAALRVGFSADATPDMGVSALYLEVATRPTMTARQIDIEEGVFTVDLRLSPYSSASVSYEVTSNDATRGVTFDYSLAGVPQTPVVVSPASSTEVQINADAFGDVSDVTLTPDP